LAIAEGDPEPFISRRKNIGKEDGVVVTVMLAKNHLPLYPRAF
jgi:hypothetical protein